MAQKTGAGNLREVLIAQRREDIEDDYGNTQGQWVEQCRFNASVEPRRGGEAVIAGRLQGTVTYIVTARYSAAAAAVAPDWRLVDARSGATYAIRTWVPRPRRDYIDADVEIGVADG
jgi:head-tail adaptor